MITDWNVSKNMFAKIAETIGKTIAVKSVFQSVIITKNILRELTPVIITDLLLT